MGWYIIPLLILVAIIVVALARTFNTGYRFGEGLFKSSEYNLDEQDEFCDKDYYQNDRTMK